MSDEKITKTDAAEMTEASLRCEACGRQGGNLTRLTAPPERPQSKKPSPWVCASIGTCATTILRGRSRGDAAGDPYIAQRVVEEWTRAGKFMAYVSGLPSVTERQERIDLERREDRWRARLRNARIHGPRLVLMGDLAK